MVTFTPQAQITNQLQLGNALLGRAAQGPQSTAAASPIANLLLGISGGLNRSAGLGALQQNQQAQQQALQNIGEALRTGDFGGASAAALQSGVPNLANVGITLAGQGATERRAAATAARPNFAVNPVTGELFNKRTGQPLQTAQTAIAGGAPATPAATAQQPTPSTARLPGETPLAAAERQKAEARERGKIAAKLPQRIKKARLAMSDLEASDEVLRTTIAKAKDIIARGGINILGINLNTAAGFGALANFIPQSDALALREALKTIRAKVGFASLQAIREASPTGGALGAVSDRENSLLQATQGSLAQAQNPGDLVTVLDQILRIKQESSAVRRQAFETDFGIQPPQSQPAEGGTQAAPEVRTLTFASQDDFQAALAGGKLRLGDTVTIAGQQFRLAE